MGALEVSRTDADDGAVIARLRTEKGFGLLELLISLTMLNVGVLAIVAAFNSGTFAIQRASQTSTASVLADKQLELYRSLLWSNIALDAGSVSTAAGNSAYTGDSAYSAGQVTKTCSGSPLPDECTAMRTLTGPDKLTYRVDSYVVTQTPPNGRAVKLVTVVVRAGGSLKTLARVSSTFDQATG